MNGQQTNHQQPTMRSTFNRLALNENLAKVFKKLNGFYIQQHFNAITITRLTGSPDAKFDDIAHERIAEIEKTLRRMNKALKKFC